MLRQSGVVLRSRTPVALFNMKHFQCKKKIAVTPSTVGEVFTKYLKPKDRLLRQSSLGAGSSRILVLDSYQCVKAVYYPTLCLPHPRVVPGGDSTLGVEISTYLDYIKPSSTRPIHTLCILSHQNGLGIASFDVTGKLRKPLVNLASSLPDRSVVSDGDDAGSNTDRAAAGAAAEIDVDLANDLLTVISDNEELYIKDCHTFYYVTRDQTCLTLENLQQLARNMDADEELPVSFDEKRWVTLLEQSLQYNAKEYSLYARGSNDAKIISEEGLVKAVSRGTLELGFTPRENASPEEA